MHFKKKYPKKIPLSYSKNFALKIFNNISHKPGSILLHSGNANHLYNRFDIISSDPEIFLITKKNITKIFYKKKIKKSKINPFNLLKKEIKKLNIKTKINSNLPFQGGALGIWSYDLGVRLTKILKKEKKELNFPDMAVGIYLWAIIVDHRKKKTTLISYENIKKRKKWLEKQNNKKTKKFEILSSWFCNMSKKEYQEKFKNIQKNLKNGNCYQVNLAQRFKIKYQGNEWEAFLKLSKQNKTPFSSFIRLKNNTILSFSPERFILLKKNIIQTRPIKGTIHKIKNSKKDKKQIKILKTSAKNKAENLMIVDLLRNDIGKLAEIGSVSVPKLFTIESFQSVHHLVSTIIAKLKKKYNAIDLLKNCFPGGSITGAPKISAMKIIENLEPDNRHGYCGMIGYISFCGTMDTNINIRTLLTEKQYLYCWGGGGITIDSICEEEYKETIEKLNKILPILKKNL